jgi:glucose/arabinose dehydrogenase
MRTGRTFAWIASLVALTAGVSLVAQQPPAGRQGGAAPAAPGARGRGPAPAPLGVPRQPLGSGPWVFDTGERTRIRVVKVAEGLVNPWSMLWMPDGTMLVTERAGRLRVIRNGVVDPTPVAGVPKVHAVRLTGFMDIALHPRFAENRWLYFTYSKPREDGLLATTLARGTFDGAALTEVKDLFVAEPWWPGTGGAAARIVFGADGMLYMTTGSNGEKVTEGQDTTIHKGKMLRLRDDGSVPPDNPFVGKAGFQPQIYSYGHRNSLGLIVHPVTGQLWNSEMGPNGGDEINVIQAGKNYGWPVVSMGRSYPGPWQGKFEQQGMEGPLVYWMPSISVSGLMVYTGDRFPNWKNNAFVGAMRYGEIAGTGHLQRIVFNDNMEEIRREMLLLQLQQRIREVKQGPDGMIYLLTEENPGSLLRIEPADAGAAPSTR